MFQQNGRSGYVLKPPALRTPDKELLSKGSKNILSVTVRPQFSYRQAQLSEFFVGYLSTTASTVERRTRPRDNRKIGY